MIDSQENIFHNLKSMIKDLSYRKASSLDQAFTLASGKKSLHYFDLKKTIMDPQGFMFMAAGLWYFLDQKKLLDTFEGSGGLTLGADPLAFALAQQSYLHQNPKYPLIVRKHEKGHGMKRLIEGYIDEVNTVLALDDVVTTGGSSIQAIQAFREAGKKVSHCLALVDRLEGAGEAMAEIDVQLISLFNLHDFDD